MTGISEQTGRLADFILAHPRLVVLTGAGISMDSGIPAYRDLDGRWLPRPPIQERDFVREPATRRRYWSRSWYGWPRMRDAQPNAGHRALAELDRLGRVALLNTQNVDGLQEKAGSANVVDLHGRVDRVRCMHCDALHHRERVQQMLDRDNDWPDITADARRPDGDWHVPDALAEHVVLPRCEACGGDLRADVVFFGGSVPARRVQACRDAVAHSDALLVVGSSLKVFSGFRFCRQARQLGKPIAIVNPGATRGDELADTLLRTPAGPLLDAAAARLRGLSTASAAHTAAP
ncbi:MAG: NAD-dependent protein deacetylase [Halioglobus sp.]|nr:NAD-dependent protein deacetylase [Halioglobus sp.]